MNTRRNPSTMFAALLLLVTLACNVATPEPTPTVDPNLPMMNSMIETAIANATQMAQEPTQTVTPEPLPTTMPPGLVFSTTDGLWKIGYDGQARHLSDHIDAKVSPDGARALYSADGDVWLVDLTTGETRNLTAGSGRTNSLPRWWPARSDTTVLSSWDPNNSEDLAMTVGYVTIVNTDSSGYRVLDPAGAGWSLPSPAPDGQTVAYLRGGQPWLYRLDSGPQPFQLADYGLQPAGDYKCASPSWSPDGKRLAWLFDRELESRDWEMNIAVFDLERHTYQLLHPHTPIGSSHWPAAPVWSPDGQWLAYVAEDAVQQSGLWVLGLGNNPAGIYLGGAFPVWSPDGRWLAYCQPENGLCVTRLADTSTWETHLLDLPTNAIPVAWLEP